MSKLETDSDKFSIACVPEAESVCAGRPYPCPLVGLRTVTSV